MTQQTSAASSRYIITTAGITVIPHTDHMTQQTSAASSRYIIPDSGDHSSMLYLTQII